VSATNSTASGASTGNVLFPATPTALAHTDPGPGGTYSRLADLGHAPATYTETARTAAGRTVEVNQIILPAHQWSWSTNGPPNNTSEARSVHDGFWT
jgi:hypothetical protein